jgi:hypothetical protein
MPLSTTLATPETSIFGVNLIPNFMAPWNRLLFKSLLLKLILSLPPVICVNEFIKLALIATINRKTKISIQ